MNFSAISRNRTLGRLLRIPLQLIPRNARMPILQGPLRGYWWIAGAATHGCWLGSYEADKQGVFAATIKPGNVVYDIGANVGFYSLLAADLAGPTGQVIAFEPLPRNVGYLRTHIAINKLSNVDVVEAAVTNQPGQAFFDPHGSPSMGQLSSDGTLAVSTVMIDDLVQGGRIPNPDAIKIDVEGAEHAVLEGARATIKRTCPVIFLATHGDQVRRQCIELLQTLGYAVQAVNAERVEHADEFIARPRRE